VRVAAINHAQIRPSAKCRASRRGPDCRCMNHRWLAVPSASRMASWLLTQIALLGSFRFEFVDWRVAGRLGEHREHGLPRE
jgi:hypothetical protein